MNKEKTYTELKLEIQKILSALDDDNIKVDELIPLLSEANVLLKAAEEKLRGIAGGQSQEH